jgi:hypothetical protein
MECTPEASNAGEQLARNKDEQGAVEWAAPLKNRVGLEGSQKEGL